jgi:hypothetical protein
MSLQKLLMCGKAHKLSTDTMLLLMGCLAASTLKACKRLPNGAGSLSVGMPPYGFMANMHASGTVEVSFAENCVGVQSSK